MRNEGLLVFFNYMAVVYGLQLVFISVKYMLLLYSRLNLLYHSVFS